MKQRKPLSFLVGLMSIIFLFSPAVFAQSLSVTGKVIDKSSHEPVAGANVFIEGTTNGTITDADGQFVLGNVPAAANLVISYIGYTTQTLRVKGKTNFNIALTEGSEALDEVVVVGYGVQKKVNLTGSVFSVKGDVLEHRPVSDATQSLQGMVPGLMVSSPNAGRPGATGTLTLRGQGNLNNDANPYVLVDGVEMSLSDVNPNDIESISILKDAAACAIYGARAAYGVILVTTKKGENGKMRVNYQGTAGWSAPTILPDMVNSYEFARFWNAGCTNTGTPRLYSDEKLSLLQQYLKDPGSVDPWFELPEDSNMNPAFENSEQGVGNTDYFDLHYKDWTFKQNHNLSLSGGGEKAQYYISGGYYSEDGVLRYADINFSRYNFAANVTSEITDWLKLKVSSKFMHSDNKTPFGEGGLSEGFYHSLARFRPTVSPVDPNGNFTELSLIPYLQSGTYTNTQNDRFNMITGLEVQPLKNWFIFLDYTYKLINTEYEALNVSPLIYGADGVSTSKGVRAEMDVFPDGKFTRSYGRTRYQSINLYTNYLFTLGDHHNFTLMGGYQEEDNSYSYMRNSITGLYSTSNPNLGMGTGDRTVMDTRNGWATRGFFGRINYDYDGRYIVELNGRYDGSSRFTQNNRWGFFPSASLGWNIAREKFMMPIAHVVSDLKLRASYGLLGNQAGAGLYTFAATMDLNDKGLGSYIFADGRHAFTKAPMVVDPNTTWEKVESKNIGLDFGFFGNTLTGSLDVFQRDTKDMLGPAVDFPDFFGAEAPETNNASMRNRGWELALNYRGRIGKQIEYSIGGSLSDATAVVTAYEGGNTNPKDNWYKGKKVGEIWGYRADGLIQTQEEADEYNRTYDLTFISGKPWTPGDVKYRNLDNNNRIDNGLNTLNNMGDMTIIGNTTPRYQYTINGSISWKGLSVSAMFQGVAKRDWSASGTYFWGSGPYAQVTVFNEHLDYWSETNRDAYYPKPYIHTLNGVVPFSNKTTTVCDRYLQNAAYCRLKNLTISYDLPAAWTKKIGLQKTQVFFSGENLLTFTSLKGMFDPEAVFTKNTSTYDEAGKNYPINKVISIGLVVEL